MNTPTSLALSRLAATRDWQRFLFQEARAPEFQCTLADFLKAEAHAFLSTVSPHPDAATSEALHAWYASGEGQGCLSRLVAHVWNAMQPLAERAQPAHDARHAMFKVPAAALEYMSSDGVQGWGRLGLLGALLHDWGRWAEEHIWGGPGPGVAHARLSYLLARQMLEAFPMPQAARDQILLAVVRHTTGAEPDDPMPLKLTVTADREQLYGAEMVLRLLHHLPYEDGRLDAMYGTVTAGVVDECTRFLTSRLPRPLFSRPKELGTLWWDLATFVLRCEPQGASYERFAKCADKLPANFDWRTAWEGARLRCPTGGSPEVVTRRLLEAPNVAPNLTYKDAAVAKARNAPPVLKPALASGLIFADAARRREDARQLFALRHIQAAHGADALVQALSSRLIANWEGPGHDWD